MNYGSSARAGWYPDPNGAPQLRYWDGSTWREDMPPRPMNNSSLPYPVQQREGDPVPNFAITPIVNQRDYSTPRVQEKGRGWGLAILLIFLGVTFGLPILIAIIGLIAGAN